MNCLRESACLAHSYLLYAGVAVIDQDHRTSRLQSDMESGVGHDAFSPIRSWNVCRGIQILAAYRVQESAVAECAAIVACHFDRR